MSPHGWSMVPIRCSAEQLRYSSPLMPPSPAMSGRQQSVSKRAGRVSENSDGTHGHLYNVGQLTVHAWRLDSAHSSSTRLMHNIKTRRPSVFPLHLWNSAFTKLHPRPVRHEGLSLPKVLKPFLSWRVLGVAGLKRSERPPVQFLVTHHPR